jgi:hypothetical protein
MYISLHVQYPLFLSGFNEACSFLTDFRKLLRYQTLRNFDPLGTELFHADGQTDRRRDMTKQIVIFRNFANALKNGDKIVINRSC